ncbi:MAG TPA: helix-hairpin-helix domain-containing protein, partial [Flavobacteriales bacterium]|nr:helix-hairpin-helix domain-containing protein [Flavobacteriales bacterium]
MAQRPLKPAKEQFKDLLHLHKGERRGTAILIVLLAGLAITVVVMQWFPSRRVDNTEKLRAELNAWMASRDTVVDHGTADTIAHELFAFDPNTITREGWRKLGLTDKQVDGIERYQRKGGRFRSKADVGRMYSIKPEQFKELEPFIQLPEAVERNSYDRPKYDKPNAQERYASDDDSKPMTHERPAFRKVEVNTADTNMLVALPGIGPAFARGIVKYRESLGGYHSLDQLAEVYVLKDKPDAVVRLKELLLLDALMVRRIAINSCTVEELAAHPYARWKIARPLIAYRQQHGAFKKVEEIKGCAVIDEEAFRKLAPY